MHRRVSETDTRQQVCGTNGVPRKRSFSILSDNTELQKRLPSFGESQQNELKRRHSFYLQGEVTPNQRFRVRKGSITKQFDELQDEKDETYKKDLPALRKFSGMGMRKISTPLLKSSISDTSEGTGTEKPDISNRVFLAWSGNKISLISEKRALGLNSKEKKRLLSISDVTQPNEDGHTFEETKQVQEDKLEQRRPIERFRKIVRLLLFLLKIKTTAHRKSTQHKDSGVFAELQDAAEEGLKDLDGMHFDPRMFKAVKEVKLSKEAIDILSMVPGTRTDEQLQTALFALKASVPAFGEYPLKMQKKLISVGWYESFEAKRVIIRQGHRAENFYFILSGSAIVTLLVGDGGGSEQRSSTIAVLTKGSSFGELALLHHKTRSATVLCKDEVALLAVGREDFRDIFMSYKEGKEPDHIRFLKTIPYLKGLPLDNLASRHDVCIFHYFRRGVVIVRDSKTEWIYVVKSGSCRALTSLVKKKAKLIKSAAKRKEETFLPVIPVDEFERRRALYTAAGEQSRPNPWSPDGKRPRTEPATREQHRARHDNLLLPALVSDPNRFKKTVRSLALPLIARRNSHQVKTAMESHRRKIDELHRTVSSQDNRSNKNEETSQGEPEEKVFVQLALFKPKDQFGLSTLLYDGAAVKCHLISNGAECVLIKKSWFLQNADEAMLRHLRSQIAPYPSQETLEQNLQDQANWDSYKSQTINDLLDTLQI